MSSGYSSQDEALVNDEQTDAYQLQRIAAERPDLRPSIALHPQAYPQLLAWLADLGDPQVDDALRRRGGYGPSVGMAATAPLTSQHPVDVAAQQFAAQDPGAFEAAAATSPVETISYPQEQSTLERRSRGGAFGVVLVLFGLVAAGAAIATYVLFFSGDDEPTAAPPSTTEQTAPEQTAPPTAVPTETAEQPSWDDEPTESEEPQEELSRPLPEGAQELSAFASPTQNIACSMDDSALSCTILEYSFDAPDDCSGPVTLRLSAQGDLQTLCAGGVPAQGTELGYDQSAGNTEFGCTSTSGFMECWNQRTGDSFQLSRESIALGS